MSSGDIAATNGSSEDADKQQTLRDDHHDAIVSSDETNEQQGDEDLALLSDIKDIVSHDDLVYQPPPDSGDIDELSAHLEVAIPDSHAMTNDNENHVVPEAEKVEQVDDRQPVNEELEQQPHGSFAEAENDEQVDDRQPVNEEPEQQPHGGFAEAKNDEQVDDRQPVNEEPEQQPHGGFDDAPFEPVAVTNNESTPDVDEHKPEEEHDRVGEHGTEQIVDDLPRDGGIMTNGDGDASTEDKSNGVEFLRQESTSGVDEILHSQAFRKELDQIIGDQLKSAPASSDLLALQQLSDYLLPKSHGVCSGSIGKGAIIPIADIQGSDAINYVDGEQSLRCKVAALYRLVDLFNWTRGFNSLITCRISQEFEYFLVVPHGLLYSEVTAASLVRVDRQGDVLDAGTTNLGINQGAFKLHAALHAARPDLKCLIHLRNPTAVSVSVMSCGLLPLCHEAMELGDTSFYDFPGVVVDDEEVGKFIRSFGPSNRILLLRNFGILVGGSCVEDAFHSADSVMTACETQLRMLPLGLKNLKLPTAEEKKQVFDLRNAKVPEGKRKFTKGVLEFEELMTLLDNAGYRTGYPYHPTLPTGEDEFLQDLTEVAAPPSASSFPQVVDDRSRSKDKKPKVYAKDTETVAAPTTPQTRPLPAPRTSEVLNVQQLKDRYREIRQQ